MYTSKILSHRAGTILDETGVIYPLGLPACVYPVLLWQKVIYILEKYSAGVIYGDLPILLSLYTGWSPPDGRSIFL